MHKGQEKMQIGVEWSDTLDRTLQQQKLDAFVAILDAGKSEYELVPDIQVWRWKKTIWVGSRTPQTRHDATLTTPARRTAAGTVSRP